MAAFALFLGEPRGEALLKKKQRLESPNEIIGLDDADVIGLGLDVDPYQSHQVWSHEGLTALHANIANTVEQLRARAQRDVLTETRRHSVEPWLEALVAQRLHTDEKFEQTTRLLALVARAMHENGTVIFFGD